MSDPSFSAFPHFSFQSQDLQTARSLRNSIVMKDSQIVEAVYEREMLHPLTPLHGLKEMDRVRLQVWLAEETENPSAGLATLAGGWDDSDALAESATAVHRSRSAARPLPAL